MKSAFYLAIFSALLASPSIAQASPIDEIIVRDTCHGIYCGTRGYIFRLFGGSAGGGSGTADCSGLAPDFPQLLWTTWDEGSQFNCSIDVQEVTMDPTPQVPGTGDVSVTVNNNYGVDPDGNGVHNFVILGPAIIVGRDANGTGIPDLWEGFVMNGLAWQIP